MVYETFGFFSRQLLFSRYIGIADVDRAFSDLLQACAGAAGIQSQRYFRILALELSSRILTSGSSAEEPEEVTCPVTFAPEAAPLFAGSLFPPQPAAAIKAVEASASAIIF